MKSIVFGAAASAAAALLLAASMPVAAEVTRLEIASKAAYGTFRAGEYVLWKGTVHGELAPTEAIPNLDKADRNARGKVEYAASILLVMPADLSKANGTLLVDIPNRGRVYGVALYNGPRDEPFESGRLDQGTGFLQDQGFALAEVSWELGKGAELPSFAGPDGKPRYVEGVGFAIARDAADFLARNASDGNPLRGAVKHTIASGKSQSGRFLKTLLLNGFNRAGDRRVFDGMHIFVSGSGLLPILQSTPGPESSANGTPNFGNPQLRGIHESPLTIGEIVARVAARGETPPRIIMLSSTSDFLSIRASLGRTGENGIEELPIPSNVRMYDIAGASHAVLLNSDCKLPRERLDWMPVSRATLLHLQRWVVSDTTPPPHRLMPLESAQNDPDVLAAPSHLPKAVVQRPKRDPDGNVMGGVRLPDVAVPLGTHAAQQEPKSGSCPLAGAFLPFALTKETREAQNDKRPSLAERYPSGRDDYVNRIRIAARALQAEGFLLDDDAAVIIAAAAALKWPVPTTK